MEAEGVIPGSESSSDSGIYRFRFNLSILSIYYLLTTNYFILCYPNLMSTHSATRFFPWKIISRLHGWKKAVAIIAAIIFIFIILGAIGNFFRKPGYVTDTVKRGTVTQTVTETGTLSASGKADIYSPTTGIISEVFVTNGEEVTPGQTLFTAQSIATPQEKQAAYADYMSAKSTLDGAQATLNSLQSSMFSAWDTYKTLAENDTYENADGSPKADQRNLPEFHIAQKNWYAAEAQFKNQQTVISSAQARTSAAWLAYQATQNSTVTAPIAGKVANLSVAKGASVGVNSALAPTEPVLSIADFSVTEAKILLGEDDISKIKVAQKVSITIDAVPGKTYTGIVRRVDTIGTLVKGVIRYGVYIEVTDADKNIRPGMNIDASIHTGEARGVLIVPNTAVKPYQGGKAVRVPGKTKGAVDYLPVVVGMRGEKLTEIKQGLSENQIIITSLVSETKKKSPFGF